MITLQTLTEENFSACLGLNADVADEEFVDPVVYSLAEAWLYGECARPFAICEEDRVIGFASLYADGENPQIINFLIGAPYRGRGYGTQAARLCIRYLQDACGAQRVSAPVAMGNERAIRFWSRLGFNPSSSIQDGYVYMRLEDLKKETL